MALALKITLEWQIERLNEDIIHLKEQLNLIPSDHSHRLLRLKLHKELIGKTHKKLVYKLYSYNF